MRGRGQEKGRKREIGKGGWKGGEGREGRKEEEGSGGEGERKLSRMS